MAELHLCSPRGFRASGVYAGIKTRQAPDVGMIVCDTIATAAAVFTTNKVVAAPVVVGLENIRGGKLHGIVVNAGNANACTGKQGEKDARRMCHLAGIAIGCDERLVLPSSTGIIGHPLPMGRIERGIAHAGHALGRDREHAFQFCDAILTTDTRRKEAAVQFKIGVVVLVFNNNSYGNVRRDQRERFDGRVVAADLVNPDFVRLAESFGVGAMRVTSPEAFRPGLEKALAHGGPYLIEIEVPRDSEVSPWAFIHPAKP